MENNNLSFGNRNGLEPIEVPFQIDDIDNDFRTELWNAYFLYIQELIENSRYDLQNINKVTWMYFFKNPIDEFPSSKYEFKSYVKRYVKEIAWYKVYELFEFVLRNLEEYDSFNYEEFVEYLKEVLKTCNAGYTLVNNRFIPVINTLEVEEIKITQALSSKFSLSNIQQHLNASIELIAKKPTPDFRNSIKESISMVEVISRLIEPENTLGKALNLLDKKKKINGTLKLGFEKLYAYTNDKNGIRHALMDEQNVDLEDARFFLVSCSAFTNYLIEKAVKEKLLK